jgi:hypothetical protein
MVPPKDKRLERAAISVVCLGAALFLFLVIATSGLNFAQDPLVAASSRCDRGDLECLDDQLLTSPALIQPWAVVFGAVMLTLAVVFAVRSRTRALVIVAAILSVLCLALLFALHSTRPRYGPGVSPYVELSQ